MSLFVSGDEDETMEFLKLLEYQFSNSTSSLMSTSISSWTFLLTSLPTSIVSDDIVSR